MNKQKILALRVVAVIIGVFFLVGVGNTQEGWNLQLEPMYMGVAGNNNHLASITTSSGSSSVTTTQNFNLGGNGTFRGQLEYMPEDWGVGISGWWFDTSSSINQNLNSPVQTNSYVSYSSNNFGLSAPPLNSGGTLNTAARSSLGLWSFDAYGIKSLGEFQNGRISMTFGAKFGGFNNSLSESAYQSPSTSYYTYYNGVSSTTYSSVGGAGNSVNSNFLVGPSIGFNGSGKYGNNRLEGMINQSVLIGNFSRKNSLVSQYWYSYSSFPINYPSSYSYPSVSSFSDSETVAIPVTEMKIKYLYDVTENLSLGLGFFASLWVDTPTPPAVQANGQQYKTLVFYGGLGSINLRY